jgi:hypothetical protein
MDIDMDIDMDMDIYEIKIVDVGHWIALTLG